MAAVKVKWQIHSVQAEQASIAADLREVEESAGITGALNFALRQIQALEESDGAREQLRRLLLILATLSLHQRGGGLRPKQVNDAIVLARSLLTAAGVQAGSSRLSFLHAELHLLVSQLHRRKGQHWSSAWEQQSALQDSRKTNLEIQATHLTAMGQRALRLGHAGLALSYFTQATASVRGPGRATNEAGEAAWLGKMRAHRLSGDAQTAAYTHKLFLAKVTPSAAAKRFLLWEEACLDLLVAGTPERLLKCVKRGGTHHDNRSLLEVSLWVKTLPQREWMDRTILVRSIGRRPESRKAHRGAASPTTHGRLYKLALALEQCYDAAVPLNVRLTLLGRTLAHCGELQTLDHELLAWAAAARFLARNNAFDLAALALLEYTALSRKLSQGQSEDVLEVVRDMLSRPWFRSVNLLG